jgi:D-xylulose reductase
MSCVPLPPNLSWPEAGCIQPLAIAVQIARRAGQLAHAAVGVMGCGPLGLLCMAVAKSYGAREIVGIDRVPGRVAFARKYAATHAEVNPEKDMMAETDQQRVAIKGRGSKLREVGDEMAWLDNWVEERLPKWGVQHGLDIVIDVTGAEPCMQLAVALLRPGGTCELSLEVG